MFLILCESVTNSGSKSVEISIFVCNHASLEFVIARISGIHVNISFGTQRVNTGVWTRDGWRIAGEELICFRSGGGRRGKSFL